MSHCYFTITTIADGQENSITGEGMLTLSAFGASLSYLDGDTHTAVVFSKDEATLSREGAYSLHLSLKEGETRSGSLGINSEFGEVSVKTRLLRYSIQKDSLLASMKYDLDFGVDTQEMQLRIYAKTLKTEGKK